MKKSLFGYQPLEVDKEMKFLNDQISQLKSTIYTLDNDILEINNRKVHLLEDKIKEQENCLTSISQLLEEKETQLKLLEQENQEQKQELDDLYYQIQDLQNENLRFQGSLINPQVKNTLNSSYTHSTKESNSKDWVAVAELKEHGIIKVSQLEEAANEIQRLKSELSFLKSQNISDSQSISKESSRMNALSPELSLKAFFHMSQMSNEVMESLHHIMNDYYNHVTQNNIEIRKEIEVAQEEYLKVLETFTEKANAFPETLRNIEKKYTTLDSFSIDTEPLFTSMYKTINTYMEESSSSMQQK